MCFVEIYKFNGGSMAVLVIWLWYAPRNSQCKISVPFRWSLHSQDGSPLCLGSELCWRSQLQVFPPVSGKKFVCLGNRHY